MKSGVHHWQSGLSPTADDGFMTLRNNNKYTTSMGEGGGGDQQTVQNKKQKKQNTQRPAKFKRGGVGDGCGVPDGKEEGRKWHYC